MKSESDTELLVVEPYHSDDSEVSDQENSKEIQYEQRIRID